VEFKTLRFDKSEGVAEITLNRPDRHNAINLTMGRELEAAWTRVKQDPEIVCAILTGAGERAFCSGADVSDVAEREEDSDLGAAGVAREDHALNRLTAIQNRCWKPVITAVNGLACGGGLHFIADADLVLCTEEATFFDTHVRVGFVAGLEPVSLARRLPLEAVLRMSLLGGSERMSSAQALALGLVGEVVSRAELMPRARDLASKIASHSPSALARTKRAIWESLSLGLEAGLDRAWELIAEQDGDPDFKEGALAFVEKRAPRWAPYTHS
jgi:enoyl-CoA hydratase/carnithine racemase